MHNQHFAHGARIGRRWRQPWRLFEEAGPEVAGLGLHRRLVQHRTRLANPSCALHSARVNCSGRVFGSTYIQAVSTAFGHHARCDLLVHRLSCPGCQHNPTAAVRHATGAHIRHSIHTLRVLGATVQQGSHCQFQCCRIPSLCPMTARPSEESM